MAEPAFEGLRSLCGGALPRLVIFDLDGTLIDSVPDIARAVDRTLLALGLAPVGAARVRGWVGRGSRRLLGDALAAAAGGAAPPQPLLDAALAFYLEDYLADCVRETRLFPGARELLRALGEAGVLRACVTNKPAAITGRILDGLGLSAEFACVVGGDSGAGVKPAPGPLLRAMEALGTGAEGTVMVGDSRHDVEAARAAQVPVACVRGGYNHGEDIRLTAPDRVLASLLELL
jgi:phosphoglycolate phosphatase